MLLLYFLIPITKVFKIQWKTLQFFYGFSFFYILILLGNHPQFIYVFLIDISDVLRKMVFENASYFIFEKFLLINQLSPFPMYFRTFFFVCASVVKARDLKFSCKKEWLYHRCDFWFDQKSFIRKLVWTWKCLSKSYDVGHIWSHISFLSFIFW